jgi:hypothetical protein
MIYPTIFDYFLSFSIKVNARMVPTAATIKMAEAAATVGSIWCLMSLNMRRGRVNFVVPMRKRARTISSNEIIKQKIAVAKMPGFMMGMVTYMNALNALAPKFRAANSMERSNLNRFALITRIAKGQLIMVCPKAIPNNVPKRCSFANNPYIAKEVIMRGMIIGERKKRRKTLLPGMIPLTNAREAMVPSTREMAVLTNASSKLKRTGWNHFSFVSRF